MRRGRSIGRDAVLEWAICGIFGLVILGCLNSLIPRRRWTNLRAPVAMAKLDLMTIRDGLLGFKMDCHRYPTEAEGLGALVVAPKTAAGWKERYLESLPLDPWGHAYIYRCPGPRGEHFLIESFGADGKPGGGGENADVEQTG
jgi:general secretion pathway protein G